jgi:hypothetical protein
LETQLVRKATQAVAVVAQVDLQRLLQSDTTFHAAAVTVGLDTQVTLTELQHSTLVAVAAQAALELLVTRRVEQVTQVRLELVQTQEVEPLQPSAVVVELVALVTDSSLQNTLVAAQAVKES